MIPAPVRLEKEVRKVGKRSEADEGAVRDALLQPIGIYRADRASQLSGIPTRTLYRWAEAGLYVPDYPGVLPAWSYRDLVYARVMAWLHQKRMSSEVAGRKVALLKKRLEDPRVRFTHVLSQGKELLAEGETTDAESGEILIKEVAEILSARELTLDAGLVGRSQQWWPDLVQPVRNVRINPEVMGGEPCIEGTRLTTAGLYVLHVNRGLSSNRIAALYPGRTAREIEQAIRLEERLQAA